MCLADTAVLRRFLTRRPNSIRALPRPRIGHGRDSSNLRLILAPSLTHRHVQEALFYFRIEFGGWHRITAQVSLHRMCVRKVHQDEPRGTPVISKAIALSYYGFLWTNEFLVVAGRCASAFYAMLPTLSSATRNRYTGTSETASFRKNNSTFCMGNSKFICFPQF